MLLKLERRWFYPHSTIGELTVDGQMECFTLEDTWRPGGEKVYGETCIPEGVYGVSVVYSPKGQELRPLLHDIPNFTSIEIHAGNSPKDTLGCILVGKIWSTDWLGQSRDAFNHLFFQINAAFQKGEKIQIEVFKSPDSLTT